MKVSTLFVFAATVMGAVADLGHPDLDLERREIALERRELEFEHKARAWLASRDAQNTLNPRTTCSGFCGYPTMPQCTAGCICSRGSCVPSGAPPTPPPTPPPTQGKGKAKPKPKKGGKKRSLRNE